MSHPRRQTILLDYEEGDTPAFISRYRKVPLDDVLTVLREVDPQADRNSISPVAIAREDRRQYLLQLSDAELIEEITTDEVKEIWRDRSPVARRLQHNLRAAIERAS